MIPSDREKKTAGAAPLPEVPSRNNGAPCVLVVDDEESVRDMVRRMLEHAGYKVLSAADGVDGVQVFAEKSSEVSVVLLDLMMPRMNGEETFRELRRLNANVKIILSSGYGRETALSMMDAEIGVAGFLPKPYDFDELLEKVETALKK